MLHSITTALGFEQSTQIHWLNVLCECGWHATFKSEPDQAYEPFHDNVLKAIRAHRDSVGAWIVYSAGPFPLFLTTDEAEANQYIIDVAARGIVTKKKFWIFGEEFGTR